MYETARNQQVELNKKKFQVFLVTLTLDAHTLSPVPIIY